MPISSEKQFLNRDEVLAKLGLVEGMKIADFGCGNLGYFIIPMAKLIGKTGQAYAIDVLKSVLEAVRSKAKLAGLTNLETVWANLEKPNGSKIADNELDVVLLKNILFQNKQHQEIIKEAARVLKKGGKLLIIEWKKIAIPFGPPLELRLDQDYIATLAVNSGLKLVEKTEFGQYFWGLVFEKV